MLDIDALYSRVASSANTFSFLLSDGVERMASSGESERERERERERESERERERERARERARESEREIRERERERENGTFTPSIFMTSVHPPPPQLVMSVM